MVFAHLQLFFCLAALIFSAKAVYTVEQDVDWTQKDFVPSIEGGSKLDYFYPTWDSLDARPLPRWYDDAKLGIFIHWGVFSVPSFGSEWFWKSWKSESVPSKYHEFMKQRYPPNFTYQDFAKDFTAEFFNATQWAKLFEASGAKYVVLTSKHHEGYTMWPSKYSFSWNSKAVGPNRDLVGELATAIRKHTAMKFGLYHSLFEFYNPLWLADQASNFSTRDFVNFKTMPELVELVELYKPEVIWSDGEWDAPDTYWGSKEFLSWLFNESPMRSTVVVNDRWGHETLCHHGSFYTCADRYNPGVLQTHKWENAMTIDRQSWGFRRDAQLSDYLTLDELIKELVVTVSCGGNLLINVGPTKDGIITPIYEERLRGIGDWLSVNGEAIWSSRPWKAQNDTLNGNVWYTMSNDETLYYASALSWPEKNLLRLGDAKLSPAGKVFMLKRGGQTELQWKMVNDSNVMEIDLPAEAHRGQPAWVIKFQEKQKRYT